ncbi:ATP-grasp domain-containing protein [Kitasatospora sp. CM 4170]|uniref:ATP-grasp domain-containing protein n=1 Tax=Kitasatospora aburaviensis TaxID=67265 RepID=A0ABW1EXP0_9ACTN|nr:ATP-grasp domain-containing protein [Kitasatospora sp. CM 4170]WNM46388.1 ATP-grasp domain-containing protein [Kitasatospora sp. CM 4170]
MIATLEDAGRVLRPGAHLGIVSRPLYLLPLLRTGALAALLSSEAADAGWGARFGVELHAQEEWSGTRDGGPGGPGLDGVAGRLPGLVGSRWRGRELRLAGYGSQRELWTAAVAATGARLLVPPPTADSDVLVDKVAMRAWFEHLGVKAPASTVVSGRPDHRVLRDRFGPLYVAQSPRGSAGNGTHLVRAADDAAVLPERERWLVSEYVGDTALNVHGFVGLDGLPQVLRPSLQLIGVAEAGAGFGQYSGCDFEAPERLSPRALSRCLEATERIGWGLAGLGYRGVFGADFVLDGDRALALEINCRMQGSTWLLGEIELERPDGRLPTQLRHVLERHGVPTLGKPDPDPASGVQLTVRHTGGRARAVGVPRAGAYALHEGALVRRGDAAGLLECGPEETVLVNLPPAGTVLHPGAVLARLVARRSLTAPDGRALTTRGRALVEALHRLYSFGEPGTEG